MFGALWVALGRDGVVIRVIPVVAPFVDVVADVVETERAGGVAGDWLGSGLPTRGVVGERLRRGIAPWKIVLFEAAASRVFPFGFRWQAIAMNSLRAQPFAAAGGFEPRNSGDGLLGTIEAWIVPERGRLGAGGAEKARVFGVGDLGGG